MLLKKKESKKQQEKRVRLIIPLNIVIEFIMKWNRKEKRKKMPEIKELMIFMVK